MYAIPDEEFYLTMRLLVFSFEEGVFARRDLDPVHTYKLRQNWTAFQKNFRTRTPVSIMKRRMNGMLLS
jgi:hypothetical protein